MHEPGNKLVPALDFEAIVKAMSDATPLVSSPNKGIGKKSYIPVQAIKQKLLIEFFSESVVSARPSNLEIGYSLSDVTSFAGVSIFDISTDPKSKKFCGEVIPFEIFLRDYVTDGKTKWALERCMEAMEENTVPDESFLEKINSLWGDREIGSRTIYDIKYN